MFEGYLPHHDRSSDDVPEIVLGYIAVRSESGASLLDGEPPADAAAYVSRDEDLEQAGQLCTDAGLTVDASSALGLSAHGHPDAWRRLTGADLVTVERLTHTGAGLVRYVTHVDVHGEGQPGELGVGVAENAVIDAMVLERPAVAMSLSPAPLPPNVSRFHLRVPDDVAVLLNAREAHQGGHIGKGVTVTMVDTGHYRHPFFVAQRYDIRTPVSTVPGMSPARDPTGHGTGESANLLAVAPGITLQPVRASNSIGEFVRPLGALVAAKAAMPRPDVITNSWGYELRYSPAEPMDAGTKAIATEILHAVADGFVIVFSAGNGQFCVEPQVPGVISAGGAFVGRDMTLRASDYASGYHSDWYGTDVPIVCGLVGMMPRASYLMLPVPPGSRIDTDRAVARDGDDGDGTASGDGWALFSGTSAAAPQVAGVAALVIGARRAAGRGATPPALVRRILIETAVDVQQGAGNAVFGHVATVGPDLATGAGLVNAGRAVTRALELP